MTHLWRRVWVARACVCVRAWWAWPQSPIGSDTDCTCFQERRLFSHSSPDCSGSVAAHALVLVLYMFLMLLFINNWFLCVQYGASQTSSPQSSPHYPAASGCLRLHDTLQSSSISGLLLPSAPEEHASVVIMFHVSFHSTLYSPPVT